MPLLGDAAMLLSFDVAPEAIADHDHWHTFEHLPERLAIPGFLRGTRWIATGEGPRYFVLYEVASLATLASPAYLERLNHPSAWTARTMPHYRGMRRAFCTVRASHGYGAGHACALVRFAPRADAGDAIARRLDDLLPALPARPGLGSAHWLEAAATPAMTAEQRIRGADLGIASALVLTAWDDGALARLLRDELDVARLEALGAADVAVARYRQDYALVHAELARASAPR